MIKFNTILKHAPAFLQWKNKADGIDIRKLDYEFITERILVQKRVACRTQHDREIHSLPEEFANARATEWLTAT